MILEFCEGEEGSSFWNFRNRRLQDKQREPNCVCLIVRVRYFFCDQYFIEES